MSVVESEGVNECVSEGAAGEEVTPGWSACMASALLLTHERHSNVYSAGLADMMKRGAKMAKASTEAPQEVRVLKRKSMSLNQEYAQGASGVVTVDVAKLSREQRSELRDRKSVV